jgi:hypothetical protein
MPIPDDSQIKSTINSNLQDSPPAQPRRITAAFLRATLFSLVDWVKAAITGATYAWLRVGDNVPTANQADTIYHQGKVVVGRATDNGSGATLQARSAHFDTINDQAAGPITVIPQPGDGLPSPRYYAVCTLPPATMGTYDYVQIELLAKPWDNSAGGHYLVDFFGSNRSTFFGEYTTQGNYRPVVGLVAYLQPNGQVNLYVKSDNNYQAISYQVKRQLLATVFTTPIPTDNVPGVLVYDTTNPSTYVPMAAIKQRWSLFKSGNADNSLPEMAPSIVGESQLGIGANLTSGRSDLTFLNNNLAGGGFSFWQRLGLTTRRLLAYLSRNGELVLGGESTTPVELLTVNGNQYLAGYLKFPQIIARRKIVLYEGSPNDYQFYGFGVLGGTLLYSVNSLADKHLFVAGNSPATSVVLGAITGDKRLGVGTDSPGYALDVQAANPVGGIVAQFINTNGAAGSTGALFQIHQGGIAVWQIGQPAGQNAFVINGWNNGAFPEYMRIASDGKTTFNGSISGKYNTASSNPSASDLADGYWRIQRNTGNGEVRMWVNVGGTIKSILFS